MEERGRVNEGDRFARWMHCEEMRKGWRREAEWRREAGWSSDER